MVLLPYEAPNLLRQSAFGLVWGWRYGWVEGWTYWMGDVFTSDSTLANQAEARSAPKSQFQIQRKPTKTA